MQIEFHVKYKNKIQIMVDKLQRIVYNLSNMITPCLNLLGV